MKQIDFVITVASWEDRFYLGLQRAFGEGRVKRVLMFYYREYASRTEVNRKFIRNLCGPETELTEIEISFGDPVETWKRFESAVNSLEHARKTLLDISTMPRDAIWSFLMLLEQAQHQIVYVYNKPEKYSADWLSRDPGRPRLVFKQSGISKLGCKTVLVAITGFDPERTEQLINVFEPKVVFLGIQTGQQFHNNRLNVEKHLKIYSAHQDEAKTFEIDAYSPGHGFNSIMDIVRRYLPENNLVLSSLGPKPTAIALYRVKRQFPEVALAYAPSNDFNVNYSVGLGDSLYGALND